MSSEVNCWNCGRLMPAEQAQYVPEPNADGTGFAMVQAASCDACVARVNDALDEEDAP